MYINFRTKKSDTKVIWDGMINTTTGEITARSNKPVAHPYEKRLNIRHQINHFPHTDEDFIILAAREKLKGVVSK